MAGPFLRSHGIDIDAEMSRIQYPAHNETHAPSPLTSITNVSLPNKPSESLWDVHLQDNRISDIRPHVADSLQADPHPLSGHGALLAPSLCHPHVHIDKAYLLSHPRYADLQLSRGDFAEAMELTGKAKARFTHEDLLERGQRLVDESVAAGVTHMRAFVEVDAGVGMKCLEAGLALKRKAEEAGRCAVQICAFAQLPLFSPSQGDEEGEVIRSLMAQAAARPEVDCLGSTPYVEADRERMERNIDWLVALSAEHDKHLDFHLDYNLDPATEPMVWHVIHSLKTQSWPSSTHRHRTVVLGHCTRLSLLSSSGLNDLRTAISDLPIHFVGLPSSDTFILHRTLDIPSLITAHGVNGCIGMNNIGNAFTPHGSCDPVFLACQGVGVYQAATSGGAEMLYECVSTRAREAIGFGRRPRVGEGEGETATGDVGLELKEGDPADFALFGAEGEGWRTRRKVDEAVWLYDSGVGRKSILGGKVVR